MNQYMLIVIIWVVVASIAIPLGILAYQAEQRRAVALEEWSRENLDRINHLDQIAKEQCGETIFYAANFERCERLDVRP